MDAAVVTSIVLGLILTVGAVVVWNFMPRRLRLKRFENRSDLSLDQIYGEFFADRNLPKQLVCDLWTEVASCLGLPPGKLRPTDRFDQELVVPKGWEFDDDIVEVQWAAERRLKQSGAQADLSQIKTVADYIEFFCNLAARRQQAL